MKVGGRLNLLTPNLVSIAGLASLREVGGTLGIGAGRLTQKTGTLLVNLDPMASLSVVGGVSIAENSRLEQIDGLANITAASKDVWLYNNDALVNINGLANLAYAQTLVALDNNDSLTDLSGLGALESVGGSLRIENNSALLSING